jgi:hypothetical protein
LKKVTEDIDEIKKKNSQIEKENQELKKNLSFIGNQQMDDTQLQNLTIDLLIDDLKMKVTFLRTEKEKHQKEKEERKGRKKRKKEFKNFLGF